jgi:signal transduction histidine kinase
METQAEGGPRPSSQKRLRVGQLLALVALAPALVVIVSVVVGILTIAHQNAVRDELISKVEPANAVALRLQIAMLNQETGIRGYELTGKTAFLQPYHLGVTQARQDETSLRTTYAVTDSAAALATVLDRIRAWESETAAPALAAGADATNTRTRIDTSLKAKAEFDAIRTALSALQNQLLVKVRSTKAQLADSARTTEIAFAVIGVALLIALATAGVLLRRLVTRPIATLAGSARQVAGGDLGHALVLSGPQDLELLAADVDDMRLRLVDELSASQAMSDQLAAAATDLRRSNTELEQFAYVASHDLQEPLRKVTSFCQLLADRYAGQLDDRADQYIGFAVDGAKRMQQLINDLLAFSRVGRGNPAFVPTPLNDLVRGALTDLGTAIEESGAEITVGELPTVAVEPGLMRTVFQNLLGNAIKFRSDQAPRVDVEAVREGDYWVIACRDNGIGIEPEYADRIFVIFQRLHTREAYPGTGIGLAMCRKIVEHHGGRMWLDETYTAGTRMCFALPTAAPATPPPTAGSQT